MRKASWLQLSFVSYLLLSIAYTASAFDNQDVAHATAQYSLSRSALITDLTITATLGLTQALIPLNEDSQRLFPDEVNSLDRSMRDKWHTKSDNFLDGTMGSLYTPITIGVVIAGLDLIEDASFQETLSELFIFVNGATANKFLNKSFKRGFSRRRPVLEFAVGAKRAELDAEKRNHESFYSGHAATAAFSTGFLRRRISQSLAQNEHHGINSGYQWLTSIGLYSWAAYVSYSRIQIDRHYFTDAATGFIMGVLFEEVYHRFNQKHWNSYSSWRLAPQVSSETFQLCFAKPFS